MTFQAWKLKYLNSMTLQVFHDLYEPWAKNFCLKSYDLKSNVLTLMFSVFIMDDLKLSHDSFFTLINQCLLLLMRCK